MARPPATIPFPYGVLVYTTFRGTDGPYTFGMIAARNYSVRGPFMHFHDAAGNILTSIAVDKILAYSPFNESILKQQEAAQNAASSPRPN